MLYNFNWRPNYSFELADDGTRHYSDGSIKNFDGMENLEPPVPLDEQLQHLERHLAAAKSTGVGIIANLTSFFDSAMLAIGVTDSPICSATIALWLKS